MCPACIATTVALIAGGSTGGFLAACIANFRKFFRANRLSQAQKVQET